MFEKNKLIFKLLYIRFLLPLYYKTKFFMNRKIIFQPLLFTFLCFFAMFKANGQKKFQYIKLPKELILNQYDSLTENDYEAYIQQHFLRNKIEESVKNVKEGFWIYFNISTSKEDSLRAYSALHRETMKFANNYRSKETLDKYALYRLYNKQKGYNDKQRQAFEGLKIGDIVVYIHENFLNVAKIINQKIVADSVRVKSIVVRDAEKAKDLCEKIIAGTITWDFANENYNENTISIFNNGDLGFVPFGYFVEDYNDYIFYYAKKGETKVITTQYGYHIVQVVDEKFVTNQITLEFIEFCKKIEHSEVAKTEALKKAMEFIKKCKNLQNFNREALILNKEVEKFNTLNNIYDSQLDNWVNNAAEAAILQSPILIETIDRKAYVVGIIDKIREKVPYKEAYKELESAIKIQRFETEFKNTNLEIMAEKFNLPIQKIQYRVSSGVEFMEDTIFISDLKKSDHFPSFYKGKQNCYLVILID
jgi:peptidyl-prolyl cis-trans isomerase D